MVPSPAAAAHTAPGTRRSHAGARREHATANTCEYSPKHQPRRSPPPLTPPATPQLPPATCPGPTSTKDPPPLRHPPGSRHNAMQPPSLGIAATGPSTPWPAQLPAQPHGHGGSGKGPGAPRRIERGGGRSQPFPAAGVGREGVKGAQQSSGEEPGTSLATGNQAGLAGKGSAVERGLGCPQYPALLHHQHPEHLQHQHPWVQPGALPCPLAAPWEHCPTTAHGQQGAPQQGPRVGNGQSQWPRESPRHEGPPAASKGLIGVKPGEFGTAARKSRPVKEPRARSGAASPQPCWLLGVGGQQPRIPRSQPRSRSCAGVAGGQRRVCTHSSGPARERGKKT